MQANCPRSGMAAVPNAVKAAVDAGMDANVNEATVSAIRDRLETFAQRLALDMHYEQYPHARPSLFDLAMAAALMDANPLAEDPELLARAASEVVTEKPDADGDDVLLYAAGLRSAAGGRRASGRAATA